MMQNTSNSFRQIERLQQRYDPPATQASGGGARLPLNRAAGRRAPCAVLAVGI